MYDRFTILCLFFATMPALAQDALVVTNANVIDGVSDQPVMNATVVIRDGKILSVNTRAAEVPAGSVTVDAAGEWLLPGLIDAHVH
jgi:imidazolonepropionase-like amidohydrolase